MDTCMIQSQDTHMFQTTSLFYFLNILLDFHSLSINDSNLLRFELESRTLYELPIIHLIK